jgi:hypothetical protein
LQGNEEKNIKEAFFFAKREIDKQKHRQVGTLHVVWSGVN